MRTNNTQLWRLTVPAGAALLALAAAARADVTVQEQTEFNLSIIKAHGTQVSALSGQKEYRSTELHCDGLMSLVCSRSEGSGEIVRLDRDLEWHLDPKRKEYRETPLANLAAAQQQMRAQLEKLKSCPAQGPSASSAPDTSKCQMSPPKFDAHQTDKHATFIGHDARLSEVTMTQSCHNPQTGDTCDFVFTMGSWLTADTIPGTDERQQFQRAYLRKLGLDPSDAHVQQQMQQFLAPYLEGLKQVSAKAEDFKGYPMKTELRVSFGGAQCAAAKDAPAGGSNPIGDAGTAAGQAAADSASGAAGSAAGSAAAAAAGNGVGGSVLGSAASAFTNKLTSGLFKKKPAPAPETASPAATTPNMVTVAYISNEVTSVSTDPVPAERFEVPAGWKLVQPKERPAREMSCPGSGKD